MKISRLDLTAAREEPWKELKPADPVGVRIGQVVLTPPMARRMRTRSSAISSTLYLADGLK